MERRIRSIHSQSIARPEPFLKYLKPGALARLRDSRIRARSHRVRSIPQIFPPSTDGQPAVSVSDFSPCFSGRMYGPRCPQRKKLVAGKAVMLSNSGQSGPVPNPDPVFDVLNSDSNTVVAR